MSNGKPKPLFSAQGWGYLENGKIYSESNMSVTVNIRWRVVDGLVSWYSKDRPALVPQVCPEETQEAYEAYLAKLVIM